MRSVCAAVGLVSPSASARHQSETLQLTTWGRSRALIQALIAEAHRAFQARRSTCRARPGLGLGHEGRSRGELRARAGVTVEFVGMVRVKPRRGPLCPADGIHIIALHNITARVCLARVRYASARHRDGAVGVDCMSRQDGRDSLSCMQERQAERTLVYAADQDGYCWEQVMQHSALRNQ